MTALTNNDPDLNNLNTYKKHLNDVKQQIKRLEEIPSINKSFFSKVSAFWGSLKLWQKLLFIFTLIAVLLVPGILANITGLIVAGSIISGFFLGFIGLFENHFHKNQEFIAYVSETIEPISKLLTGVIEGLADIYYKLKEQIHNLTTNINSFQNENIKLQTSITKVNTEVDRLHKHSEDLQKENKELDSLIETLRNMMAELVGNLSKDQTKREQFIIRLDKFIENKEQSFLEIVDRISNAELELERTIKNFQELYGRFESLFIKYNISLEEKQAISQIAANIPTASNITQSKLQTYSMYNHTNIEEECKESNLDNLNTIASI